MSRAHPFNISRTSALISVSLVAAAAGCTQIKAANTFSSPERFFEWVEYYYLKPNPEMVEPALTYYADTPLYDKANRRMILAEFFAALFKDDPALMQSVFKTVNKRGSDRSQSMLLRVLWLTDTDQSRELFEQAGSLWNGLETQMIWPKISGKRPLDTLHSPPRLAHHVDKLWFIFYANGYSSSVKQIISVLHYIDPVSEASSEQRTLGDAAKNSLIDHGLRHRAVNTICREEIQYAREATRLQLKEILDAVKLAILRDGDVKPR